MITKNNIVSGWSFPVGFNKDGTTESISGHEKIKKELTILLSTLPGERLVDNKYGCDLQQFLFSEMDSSLINKIQKNIVDSIKRYMHSITVTSTDIELVDGTDNTILITINYVVNNSGADDKLSMPLNLNGDSN